MQYWLQSQKRDMPYDEYGEPLGTAFSFKGALRESKEAAKSAEWDGYSGVRSRIFKLTAKGLREVFKTGKNAGKAKPGAVYL